MQVSEAQRWTLEPRFPKAPSTTEWQAMSTLERLEVCEQLGTAHHEVLDTMAPEGTRHEESTGDAIDRLRQWMNGGSRAAFVARNLRVYYPAEDAFEPDIMVVLGVPQEHRDSWIVSAEGGKGLDVVFEFAWKGNRQKDLDENVRRYARLGIPEYYVIDLRKSRFYAFHLATGGGAYQTITPQDGRVRSPGLDVDLYFDGYALRLMNGIVMMANAREGLGHLQVALARVSSELNIERDRAETERERAEAEKARADALERRLRELLGTTGEGS
ncbi:MAG: Uma2 family endonuclease [Myxococcales bacterium]|nr:Uma2 family endonuclease [Myxococcales bacterium]